VLDLAECAPSLDQAIAWLSAACCRRLTTPSRLLAAVARRPRLRRRVELVAALSEIADGAHSLLEVRYVRRVERPHGLPRGRRQRRIVRGGRVNYDDVCYEDYGLIVELDGRVAHPGEARKRDRRRDNFSTLRGDGVLRYDLADVTEHPCATAREVAEALSVRGWPARLRPCGRECGYAKPFTGDGR
jgi:very-short-patch-repair endonuclease